MVFCKVHLIIFTCSLELNKMNMLVFQLQLFCFCILAQVKKLSDFLVRKRTNCFSGYLYICCTSCCPEF